jgi:membrane dipeptidase
MATYRVIDGHNDLLWELRERVGYDFDRLDIAQSQPALHTDLARLRAGGVGAQFWSLYVPDSGDPVAATLEQVDAAYAMAARYPDAFALTRTAGEVERAWATDRIACLLGMEGGHSIASSLGVLRMFAALGVRYMTLTHQNNVPWADSATDAPVLGGLSRFGEEVVREMNRLGMLVDLSHVSADTMRAALRIAAAPAIFSHSSAYAVCPVPRNVPDDVLESLAANGGVVMATFVPYFVTDAGAAWFAAYLEEKGRLRDAGVESLEDGLRAWQDAHPQPVVTVGDVADHVDHLREVAGVDHVGLGGDYDGMLGFPAGLPDVSSYPVLFAELAGRGWSDADLVKVAGANSLRVLRDAEDVAADLSARRGPSLVTRAELDGS